MTIMAAPIKSWKMTGVNLQEKQVTEFGPETEYAPEVLSHRTPNKNENAQAFSQSSRFSALGFHSHFSTIFYRDCCEDT
jgi:hypothetical protein